MLRRAVAAEARRRISLAPARLAHELAQPQAESVVPERRGLEPSWVPLYKRSSKVSHGRPPGIVAAEMDEWLRQRLRLSQDQVLAYVRELRKFKKNEGALERLRDCSLSIVYFLYVRVAFIITMSTDAERAAAEKADADKKAAASAWPTGGYNSFIPLLLFSVLAMLALYVDLSAISVVCASLTEYQYAIICVNAMLVIYSWINLIEKLPIYSTLPTATMLLDWMEAHGAKLRLGHHALRLDLISKVCGIQAAEKYFWSLPDICNSVKTYSCLLNCYGKHGLAYKGLELYEKMKAKNIVPDKLVYNNLMILYQKAGQPEKILSTFEEMRGSGVSANKFTYFTLIESYITMNDLDAAEKVLEELQKVAPVHWSLYTRMANNYIKLKLFGKAEIALKKAEEVMDKADLRSWYALLSLHAHCGNSTEVKRIWKSLKSTFKKCLNRSYLVMLQGLSMIDDFESLQQIFQEWQSNHEHYDMRITNIMIKAYLDKNMIDEAEAIRQSTMAQGRCDERTVYIFAEFYLDKSDVNTALEILRDAKNMVTTHKWVPTKELVSRFLKHHEESKDVAGAESFVECLKKLECLDPDAYERS
uniref:Pentatricopeptide repeat-containing protein n=1 Tax=Aegilops tauschii TaxID=37682 RepID=M8AQ09_AEGTA